MQAEHVKQIIELVGTAGEGAYILAILLIAQGYFKFIIGFGLLAYIAASLHQLAMRCIDQDRATKEIDAWLEMQLIRQGITGAYSREAQLGELSRLLSKIQ